MKEFYTNMSNRRNLNRNVERWIPFEQRAISQLFGLKQGGDCSEFEKLLKNPNFEEIARDLTIGQGEWQKMKIISNAFLNRGNLIEVNKVWFYLVNSVFKPSKNVFTMRQDRVLLLYALVKGFELNVGKIIKESILDYAESKFSGNIPHPSLMTLLYIKEGGGGGGGGGGNKVQ